MVSPMNTEQKRKENMTNCMFHSAFPLALSSSAGSDSDGLILGKPKRCSSRPDLQVHAKVRKHVVIREERAQTSDEGRFAYLAGSDAEYGRRRQTKRSQRAVGQHARQKEKH